MIKLAIASLVGILVFIADRSYVIVVVVVVVDVFVCVVILEHQRRQHGNRRLLLFLLRFTSSFGDSIHSMFVMLSLFKSMYSTNELTIQRVTLNKNECTIETKLTPTIKADAR